MSDTNRPELDADSAPRDNVDRGSDGAHRIDETLDQVGAAGRENRDTPDSIGGENPSFTQGDTDPASKVDDEKDPHVDRQLDKGLKETFPASDPVSINPGAD